MSFPKENFGELSGMTFEEVFLTKPKWIECVDSTWKNCTGLFLKFYKFVKNRLQDPISRFEHIDRCEKYIKTLEKSKIPKYLLKYDERTVNQL